MELVQDITLSKVYDAKRQMERKIELAINEFEHKTGLKVQSIAIERDNLAGSRGIDNLLSVKSEVVI